MGKYKNTWRRGKNQSKWTRSVLMIWGVPTFVPPLGHGNCEWHGQRVQCNLKTRRVCTWVNNHHGTWALGVKLWHHRTYISPDVNIHITNKVQKKNIDHDTSWLSQVESTLRSQQLRHVVLRAHARIAPGNAQHAQGLARGRQVAACQQLILRIVRGELREDEVREIGHRWVVEHHLASPEGWDVGETENILGIPAINHQWEIRISTFWVLGILFVGGLEKICPLEYIEMSRFFFFGSSPFLDKPTPHWEENYTWLYDYTVGIYWNLLIALKHDHSKWSLGSPSGPGQKC